MSFLIPRRLKLATNLLTIALFAVVADHSAYSHAVPQVTTAVDSRSFSPLKGSVHALVRNGATDLGAVPIARPTRRQPFEHSSIDAAVGCEARNEYRLGVNHADLDQEDGKTRFVLSVERGRTSAKLCERAGAQLTRRNLAERAAPRKLTAA